MKHQNYSIFVVKINLIVPSHDSNFTQTLKILDFLKTVNLNFCIKKKTKSEISFEIMYSFFLLFGLFSIPSNASFIVPKIEK